MHHFSSIGGGSDVYLQEWISFCCKEKKVVKYRSMQVYAWGCMRLQVMPVLAWCFIADGLTAVQGGVLRGAGERVGRRCTPFCTGCR